MAQPIRAPGPRRRGRSINRASSLVSRVRLLAAVVLLLTSAGFYGLTNSPIFALDRGHVAISGLNYTDEATAMTALGFDTETPNLFRIRTGSMEAALTALPAVRSASVRAILPDRLEVTVDEREPILVWRHDTAAFLADVDGLLFSPAVSADAYPVIDDERTDGPVLAVGVAVPPADLEVARTLGAVTPIDLGSAATTLTVAVEDDAGWVIAVPGGWRAVFGHFTATLRPTSLIDGQVQCLAALLATGESSIGTVTLALTDQACGTYVPVATPSSSPEPTRSRRP